MRQVQIIGLSALLGAALMMAIAEGNIALELFMGGTLGAALAVVVIAFPANLGDR